MKRAAGTGMAGLAILTIFEKYEVRIYTNVRMKDVNIRMCADNASDTNFAVKYFTLSTNNEQY